MNRNRENSCTAVVIIGGEKKEYAVGTTYLSIAGEHQPQFDNNIILFFVNRKLYKSRKKVTGDYTISLVTTKDKPGLRTYQRGVTLTILRAFYGIVGVEHIEKIPADFSIGEKFFVEPGGDFELTDELLEAVKTKVREYMETKLPIMKRNVNTDEAVELFTRYRMYDEAKLLQYRRVSRVDIHSIGNFEDCFYGYMVQNMGYTRYFDLVRYEHGFVLMPLTGKGPETVPHFDSTRKQKLLQALKESSEWGKKLGVANVGALNEMTSCDKANELILVQEALQGKKIGQIAEMIVEQEGKKFVMIAGPSPSGKTTFFHRLSIRLKTLGTNPHPIGVDDYFINRVNSPRDADGNYSHEILECLGIKQSNEDMTSLLNGKTAEMLRYNFITGVREYKGNPLIAGEDDILVIEGIHCLSDRLSYTLPKGSKFRVYISALTQLNIDEHDRMPTMDGRLIRRMVRDTRTRGASAQTTIRMWPSMRRGEEDNIFPFQEEAGVMFSSTSVYELAVLKQYAEPIPSQIPRDSEECLEAKRLLRFSGYFLGVNNENTPQNSIVREFIGGGCFRV